MPNFQGECQALKSLPRDAYTATGNYYRVAFVWEDCHIIEPSESYYLTFNLEQYPELGLEEMAKQGATFSCVLNLAPE